MFWISDVILVTVGLDKTIKLWNFLSKKLLCSQKVADFIQNLTFIKNLNTLIFIDNNGQIGFWKEESFKLPEKMDLEPEILVKANETLLKAIETPQNNISTLINFEKKPEENIIAIQETTKQSESIEKKIINQKNPAELWIDAAPQSLFHSSETSFFKSRRFLCWNLIGNIIIRKDNEYNFLDIDFSDRNFHKNIRTRDIYHLEMGDMNYCGAIMASRAIEVNENEYEDEIHNDESKKFSYIQFKCFSYVYEPCDWTVKLQKGEVFFCIILK